MAPKAKKKSGATKKTSAKAAKKTARKASKSSAKKTVRTKSATKKTATKKAAKKRAAAKPAKSATTGAKRKSTPVSKPKEAILALDDLTDVDDLVADKPPKAKKTTTKDRSPQTPSVPRSVKPPPKETNMEVSGEILEFVDAIDAYRQENCRPFPTWTEVFHILKRLGYTKS